MPNSDRDLRDLKRSIDQLNTNLKALDRTLRTVFNGSMPVKLSKYLGIPAEEALENAKAGAEQARMAVEKKPSENPVLCITCKRKNCVPESNQKYVLIGQCDCCDSNHNLQ